MTALVVAACGSGANSGGNANTGGAGTETGSPGMSSDTGMGAMDTAMTDTTTTSR